MTRMLGSLENYLLLLIYLLYEVNLWILRETFNTYFIDILFSAFFLSFDFYLLINFCLSNIAVQNLRELKPLP